MRYEPRLLKLGKVARDSRPADRKFGCQVADATGAVGQSKNQLPPLGIAESLKG
jgi:hypothetical protein